MRTEYFDCFNAVVKYKNFSVAADSLYLSQSSLSKMIKSLEEQLGGSLFIRGGKNQVLLSPFGKYISQYITTLTENLDLLKISADNFKLNQPKRLCLSTFPQLAFTYLLQAIIAFEKREPGFHFEIDEVSHNRLNNMLSSYGTELCLAYSNFISSAGDYQKIPLGDDPLVLVSNRSLAQERGWKSPIALYDARDENFLF